MNKYPIYIPSKGRAEINATARQLQDDGVAFYMVIEPQDEKEYSKYYDNLLVMPENSKGIAYARRFIKEHSEKAGDKYHWQMDDDIKNFKIRSEGKNKKVKPREALLLIEQYVDEYENIAIAGMNDAVYAWTKKEMHAFNKQQATSCLFKNNTDVHWQDDIVEDTLFSLQSLLKGYVTVLFNWVLYEKYPNDSLKGGLASDDITGKNTHKVNLSKAYPSIFKLEIKNGKFRIKPTRIWQKFKQRPIQKSE